MDINLSNKTKRRYLLGTTFFCAEGFFYGASSNFSYGYGMVLSLNKDHYFSLILGGGRGTNTKDELLSLWGLLQFSSLIGISYINIFGDSKVIIEWMIDKYNLQVLLIKQWCQRVHLLKIFFSHITFRHL